MISTTYHLEQLFPLGWQRVVFDLHCSANSFLPYYLYDKELAVRAMQAVKEYNPASEFRVVEEVSVTTTTQKVVAQTAASEVTDAQTN